MKIEVNNAFKRDIADELTKKFSQYQYRLEKPMPEVTESSETYRLAYLTDNQFHSKVDSMVAGVMAVIDNHV